MKEGRKEGRKEANEFNECERIPAMHSLINAEE